MDKERVIQKDLLTEIASISGVNKVICEKVYEAMIHTFKTRLINGTQLTLYGFGVLKPIKTSDTKRFDINSGKVIKAKGVNTVSFKVSEVFKKELNNEEE